MSGTINYDALCESMQAMVRKAVVNACNFINDQDVDEQSLTIDNVKEQSRFMMKTMIDPEQASIELPELVQKAIDEYIDARIGFAVVF